MKENKIHIAYGFHVNCYHSYRGDSNDNLGFGSDIRIINKILDVLTDFNEKGVPVKGTWDTENFFSLEKILSLLESLLSTSQEIIERLCYALHSIGFFLFDGKNIQVLKPALPIMLYDVLQEKAIYKTQPEKIFSSTSQILLKTFVTAALKEGTIVENGLTEISGHAFNQAAPVYSKGSRKIFQELENHKILQLKPASSENFNDDKLYGNLKYIQDLLELNRIYPLLDQELAKHL
jgi:hypothetical protein